MFMLLLYIHETTWRCEGFRLPKHVRMISSSSKIFAFYFEEKKRTEKVQMQRETFFIKESLIQNGNAHAISG